MSLPNQSELRRKRLQQLLIFVQVILVQAQVSTEEETQVFGVGTTEAPIDSPSAGSDTSTRSTPKTTTWKYPEPIEQGSDGATAMVVEDEIQVYGVGTTEAPIDSPSAGSDTSTSSSPKTTTWKYPEQTIGVEEPISTLAAEETTIELTTIFTTEQTTASTASGITTSIAGGASVGVLYGDNHTFDAATFTVDLANPGSLDGFTFIWQCRRVCENWTEYDDTFTTVIENMTSACDNSSESGRVPGCLKDWSLNDGTGTLYEGQSGIFTVETIQLQKDFELYVRVLAKKGDECAVATQIMLLVSHNTPTVEVQCFGNCMENLNPAERLALCASASNTNSTDISWTWILYRGSSATSLIPVPEDEWLPSSTGEYASCVVIDTTYWSNQAPESEFTLAAFAQPIGQGPEDVGAAFYSFGVSGPLLPANCSINPEEGVAVTTEFNVSCGDFETQNKPISYKIGYTVDGTIYTWVASGSDLSVIGGALLLPLGIPEFSYFVNVSITAQDSIGMSAYVVVSAAVYAPSAADLSNMLSFLIDSLDPSSSSLNFSDSGQALSFVGAFAMTLNNMNISSSYNSSGNDTVDLSYQLSVAREAMTEILNQIPLDNVDTVNSVQSVLTSVLSVPSQVSGTARGKAASILEGSANFLSNVSINSIPITQLDNTLEQAMNTADVLLSANSYAAQNQPEMDDSKDVAPRVMVVLDVLGSVISSSMVIGDSSRIINSPTITMVVDKKYSSLLASGPLGDPSTGNCIAIPDSWSSDNGTSAEEPVVSSQVKVFTNCPYVSKADNTSIDSSVVMVKISDSDGGSAVSSDYLPKPVHTLSSRQNSDVSASGYLKGVASPFHQITALTHKIRLQPNRSISIAFDWYWNSSDANSTLLENPSEKADASSNYSLFVMLSVDRVPSRLKYDFNCTLPVHFTINSTNNQSSISGGGVYSSSCSASEIQTGACQGEEVYKDQDLFPNADPSSINKKLCYIPASMLRGSLLYLRVRYLNPMERQSVGSTSMADFYTPGVPSSEPPIEYSAQIYSSDCGYWNPFIKQWNTDGCMGGPMTDESTSHCICDRLSVSSSDNNGTSRSRRSSSPTQSSTGISFGAGLTITVNAPNFSDSAFNHLDDSPLIFSVMLSVICIYLCFLVWTIKRDRVDDQAASVVPLIDNEPENKYLYEVTICTGNMAGAGTSANVFIVFVGDNGETFPRAFCSKDKSVFKRGGVDNFLMAVPDDLGALSYLRVWHDNTGQSQSWFLSRIVVIDLQTSRRFYFVVNNWLSDTLTDCLRCRIINVSGKGDLTSFGNIFMTKTRKDLVDGHLWFSVLGRPITSRFSRTQRCTCCITLLFSLMTANIMFYNRIATTNFVVTIGPVVISAAQVVQGVIASLVVLPLNIIIVQVFRMSEAFQIWTASRRRKRRVACNNGSLTSVEIILQKPNSDQMKKPPLPLPEPVYANFSADSKKTAWFQGSGKQPSETSLHGVKRVSRKWILPWWCIFIAYFLCLITCAVSFWYVVEIGFALGQEASTKWLVSFLTSVVESIFLSQPIKVILKAMAFAVVIKKPAHDDESVIHKGKREDYLEKHIKETNKTNSTMLNFMRSKILAPPAPSRDIVIAAEEKRKRQNEMVAILKEVGVYLIFVSVMMMTSYGNLDVNSERAYRVLENTISFGLPQQRSFEAITLEKVKEQKSLWEWLSQTVVSSVYQDCIETNSSDIISNSLKVCSGFSLVKEVRLRQFRIKEGIQCSYEVDNRTSCYGDYLSKPEDMQDYGEGWIRNFSGHNDYSEAWLWRSEANCNGHPMVGSIGKYAGSGYTASLGSTSSSALATLAYLEEHDWIDERSRAVMVEFASYNPNVNLLSVSSMLMELLPLGVIRPVYGMAFVRYEPYLRDGQWITLAAEIGCAILVCYFTYLEFGLVAKLKSKYIKSFGHMLDMVNLLLCYIAVCILITKVSTLEVAKSTVSQNGLHQFTNFQSASFWNECYRSCLGMTTFVATIKFLKLLRFNSRISMLTTTLKAIQKPLLSFTVVLVIVYLGFVHSTFLVYGGVLPAFSSFVSTCQQIIIMMLNKFDYSSLATANPTFAPVFLVGFVSIINFFMLNVMMTIIMEGFHETRVSLKYRKNKHEILQFMLEQFKTNSGLGSSKLVQPEADASAMTWIQPAKWNLIRTKMHLIGTKDSVNILFEKQGGSFQSSSCKVSWQALENHPDWFLAAENACFRLDKAFNKLFDPTMDAAYPRLDMGT